MKRVDVYATLPLKLFIANRGYKTGDMILATSEDFPLIKHRGIVVVEDDGRINVFQCSLFKKHKRRYSIVKESLEEWTKNRLIKSVEPTNLTKEEIVRASNTLGDKCFDVFSFNCEQYAYFIKDGEAKSPQLLWWGVSAGMVLLGLGAWYLLKHKNEKSRS
jgi:hypothetical protein